MSSYSSASSETSTRTRAGLVPATQTPSPNNLSPLDTSKFRPDMTKEEYDAECVRQRPPPVVESAGTEKVNPRAGGDYYTASVLRRGGTSSQASTCAPLHTAPTYLGYPYRITTPSNYAPSTYAPLGETYAPLHTAPTYSLPMSAGNVWPVYPSTSTRDAPPEYSSVDDLSLTRQETGYSSPSRAGATPPQYYDKNVRDSITGSPAPQGRVPSSSSSSYGSSSRETYIDSQGRERSYPPPLTSAMYKEAMQFGFSQYLSPLYGGSSLLDSELTLLDSITTPPGTGTAGAVSNEEQQRRLRRLLEDPKK
ncbi:unnamed protein product [Peniophora sp. CBMAI 1063]|nr:unnamed protein product [Peniophora sp. CBMAI 1063]